jgi:E3 ubiquitin-protein ligase HUWE1
MEVKWEDCTDADKKELDHAFGEMKVTLHILHPIVSAKPLFESGQTLLVVTRDKKDTDPDYFSCATSS